ncbi:hypothetical protein [Aureimonas sp. N4]|uniref:hypothetical protein n=1 Tax=Aureimonas sp. N4 TaxID=1638165 RepID=UPI000780FF60|nr:hypothetical protein [Aureimonas sp. N4]
MTKFPIMRVRVTLPTRIVAELKAISDRDGKSFDEVVAAAILVLSETRSDVLDAAYVRSRVEVGEPS